jgi:hypothetical protein
MWHYTYTKFHEDWYRRSRNFKVFLSNFSGCNVGNADGKKL